MEEPVIHGIYHHFKSNYYLIENIALHSETGEEMVVYRQLYGDGTLYVRPKAMFLEEIPLEKIPEGQPVQKHRFELQKIESRAKQ